MNKTVLKIGAGFVNYIIVTDGQKGKWAKLFDGKKRMKIETIPLDNAGTIFVNEVAFHGSGEPFKNSLVVKSNGGDFTVIYQ